MSPFSYSFIGQIQITKVSLQQEYGVWGAVAVNGMGGETKALQFLRLVPAVTSPKCSQVVIQTHTFCALRNTDQNQTSTAVNFSAAVNQLQHAA